MSQVVFMRSLPVKMLPIDRTMANACFSCNLISKNLFYEKETTQNLLISYIHRKPFFFLSSIIVMDSFFLFFLYQ